MPFGFAAVPADADPGPRNLHARNGLIGYAVALRQPASFGQRPDRPRVPALSRRSSCGIGKTGLLIEGGLADSAVRITDGAQFVIGGVFQHQKGVIGPRESLPNLIELALRGCLLPEPECAG